MESGLEKLPILAPRTLVQSSPAVQEKSQPPLDEYFNSLFTTLGPQHWWPGKTPFEIIVGAILTQSTSWTNVERALRNLRGEGLLTPASIEQVPLRRLQTLIRASGYWRQKASALKSFVRFLRHEYRGSLKRMFETPTIVLRYAGQHGVFVVDAYTKRILVRHGWANKKAKYDDIRWQFERRFPGNVKKFNEFHALIVASGKNWCRKTDPKCSECPLGRYLEEGR
jgi:endonuclease-3 related protein